MKPAQIRDLAAPWRADEAVPTWQEVEALLERAELSTTQAGEACGLSSSYALKWRQGVRTMPYWCLKIVAGLGGVQVTRQGWREEVGL